MSGPPPAVPCPSLGASRCRWGAPPFQPCEAGCRAVRLEGQPGGQWGLGPAGTPARVHGGEPAGSGWCCWRGTAPSACSGAWSIGQALISPLSLPPLLSRTEIVSLRRSPHPERALVQAHPLLHCPRQDRSVSHAGAGGGWQPPLGERILPGCASPQQSPRHPRAPQGSSSTGNAAVGGRFPPLLAATSQRCSQDLHSHWAPSPPPPRRSVLECCRPAGEAHSRFVPGQRGTALGQAVCLSCTHHIPAESSAFFHRS